MTLNLIEKGIETYKNFNQKQLSRYEYEDMKQSLAQILYILVNVRGKEQLDNTTRDFIIRKIGQRIVGTMNVAGLSNKQNHYHIASIALSLLCIASR